MLFLNDLLQDGRISNQVLADRTPRVSSQGNDIVSIPGTKRVAYLEQNGAADEIALTNG